MKNLMLGMMLVAATADTSSARLSTRRVCLNDARFAATVLECVTTTFRPYKTCRKQVLQTCRGFGVGTLTSTTTAPPPGTVTTTTVPVTVTPTTLPVTLITTTTVPVTTTTTLPPLDFRGLYQFNGSVVSGSCQELTVGTPLTVPFSVTVQYGNEDGLQFIAGGFVYEGMPHSSEGRYDPATGGFRFGVFFCEASIIVWDDPAHTSGHVDGVRCRDIYISALASGAPATLHLDYRDQYRSETPAGAIDCTAQANGVLTRR
jgi:hypothetical protein